jgi:cytochrome c-type biogenesis protein CcmH
MRVLGIVVGLLALAVLGTVVIRSEPPSAPPSARALEATLLAPCCFGGTLDVHDSDISRQLRAEIESRVGHGESTLAVQADLVARYGPQIRAMPDAGVFSATMSLVMIVIVAGGVATVRLVRRWSRDEVQPRTAARPARPHDAEDERLDAELEALD